MQLSCTCRGLPTEILVEIGSLINIYISRSRKFFQRGPNLITFFLVDKGIEDTNTAIIGPSSASQRNAISMAFRWRADDGPTLNAGLVAW